MLHALLHCCAPEKAAQGSETPLLLACLQADDVPSAAAGQGASKGRKRKAEGAGKKQSGDNLALGPGQPAENGDEGIDEELDVELEDSEEDDGAIVRRKKKRRRKRKSSGADGLVSTWPWVPWQAICLQRPASHHGLH